MKYIEAYSHNNGEVEWNKRDMFEWITDLFEVPAIKIQKGSTTKVRDHIRGQLDLQGWSGEVKLSLGHELTVFSMKGDLAFQIQTGNISRAPYDLIKIQYLYASKKIAAAALAVPSTLAGQRIGSNIANFNRIMAELRLFDRVITVPLLLISFE